MSTNYIFVPALIFKKIIIMKKKNQNFIKPNFPQVTGVKLGMT